MRKRRRTVLPRPELSANQILEWADAFHARIGRWPTMSDGPVTGGLGLTWAGVNSCLYRGLRGLPGGSSVARLLAERRGHRNRKALPKLTEKEILSWADSFHRRNESWPTTHSGIIPESGGTTWKTISEALRHGARGLPGGSSLRSLLFEHRGVSGYVEPMLLSVAQILQWADNFHDRTGRWPKRTDGAVAEGCSDTWAAIETALTGGFRGLAGGSSLARLLAAKRGRRNAKALPQFTEKKILAWADAYHRRTGSWPHIQSGEIASSNGETWRFVDAALRHGCRGLPGGSSLARLLATCRGVRNHLQLPSLTEKRILRWADAHHRRIGRWPGMSSGEITDAPDERWSAVDNALREGNRGLPGGSSLARLLERHRAVPNQKNLPALTVRQILAWADSHHRRTAKWPQVRSGPIPEAGDGQTWLSVEGALRNGCRGLPGGTTLRCLLQKHGRRSSCNL
jgi:hypothetical protein